MSIYSGDYRFYDKSDGGTKPANCVDCQKSISKYDTVEVCREEHIFHQYCWIGSCTTNYCKRIANESGWRLAHVTPLHPEAMDNPVGVTISGISVSLVATAALIGLIILFRAAKYIG